MSNEESVPPELVARVESLRGPAGWINWRAAQLGMPRRTEHSPRSLMMRPIWEEFALYSDTRLGVGEIRVGPFDLLPIEFNVRPSIGRLKRMVVMRQWDHIFDGPMQTADPGEEVTNFVGGGVGAEMAALLGLALGRRFRSGGSVRAATALEREPIGKPDEMHHSVPVLETPHDYPMLPGIVEEVSLEEARTLLELYPALDAPDAVALVRSARQYVDGLWLADGDPRLAWIKLVGALEAAANRRDDARHEDPVAQLKRHKPHLHRLLAQGSADVLDAVAGEVARLFRQSSKVWSFVKAFDPGPPPARPSEDFLRIDWSHLEEAIFAIYDHRSRDLHDGIPWPPPLCEPPEPLEADIPERVLGPITGLGARWSEERMPMRQHVFVHLVGGALRNWWRSLGEQAEADTNDPADDGM